MSNAVATKPNHPVADPINPAVLSSVLLDGDLAKLNDQSRVDYMLTVCRTLGLNPTTKPFEFIRLNGKLVMYAKRDCTEQLRKIHGVSITIKAREVISGVYVVTANAQDERGRVDESTGAVPVENVKGENLANAMMKAETKAKRRVTLSICGLGLLDETEVESVAPMESAQDHGREKVATVTGEVKTKIPKWSDDQTAEAGTIRSDLMEIGGDAADRELRSVYNSMKYDDPADTLAALRKLLAKWMDIQNQEPVVVEGIAP